MAFTFFFDFSIFYINPSKTVTRDLFHSDIIVASATTVITTDQGLRGGKVIPLKQTVDEAVLKCPGVKRVFVSSRTGADIPMGKMDLNLEQVLTGDNYNISTQVL